MTVVQDHSITRGSRSVVLLGGEQNAAPTVAAPALASKRHDLAHREAPSPVLVHPLFVELHRRPPLVPHRTPLEAPPLAALRSLDRGHSKRSGRRLMRVRSRATPAQRRAA